MTLLLKRSEDMRPYFVRSLIHAAMICGAWLPVVANAQLDLPTPGDPSAPLRVEKAEGGTSNAWDRARDASANLIAQSSLQAKLQELAGNLRGSGPHAVSSKSGEKVISMVRMLPKADSETRAALMRRLEAFAKDSVPEALTFMGFAAEQGAFGVPKQPDKAAQLYRAAAQHGYQTALYDLALMNAYGRAMPRNLRGAESLLTSAVAAGGEGSNRVCGMASFVAYRLNDTAGMRNFSDGCTGPLSALAVAAIETGPVDDVLIGRLKNSIATGVDDGYYALEAVTRRRTRDDTEFSYCLWSLVNRYRAQPGSPLIASDAATCVEAVSVPGSKVASLEPVARQQAAFGLARTVGMQIQELAANRKASNFHFGMPVPYLPFTQDDVDLFAVALGLAIPR